AARGRRAAWRRGADAEPDGRARPHARARRRALRQGSRPFMVERGVVLVEPRRVVLEEIRVDPPGPGEVLVRIDATGVCHSDLHVIQEDGWHHPYPVLLGHEGAGTVETLGEGVTSLVTGDRVVLGWKTPCGTCSSCARGEPR